MVLGKKVLAQCHWKDRVLNSRQKNRENGRESPGSGPDETAFGPAGFCAGGSFALVGFLDGTMCFRHDELQNVGTVLHGKPWVRHNGKIWNLKFYPEPGRETRRGDPVFRLPEAGTKHSGVVNVSGDVYTRFYYPTKPQIA